MVAVVVDAAWLIRSTYSPDGIPVILNGPVLSIVPGELKLALVVAVLNVFAYPFGFAPPTLVKVTLKSL